MRESIFVPRLAIAQDMLSLKMRSLYNELRLKSVHVFPLWRVGVAAAVPHRLLIGDEVWQLGCPVQVHLTRVP
jgi:hypothetical protein